MIREISTRAAHVGWVLLAMNIFFAWLGSNWFGADNSLPYIALGLVVLGTVALLVLLIAAIVKKWNGILPLVFALLLSLGAYPFIIATVMMKALYIPAYNSTIDAAEEMAVDAPPPVP